MKICYLVPYNSVHSQKIYDFFKQHGYETQVITFDQIEIKNQNIHHIEDNKNFLSKLFILKRIIRNMSPDILHAHQVIGYGMWGELSGFHPLVISPWGSDVEVLAKESFFNNHIARHVLKKADMVHVSSQCMAKTVKELGCPENKLFIKVMGTDINKFSPNVRDEKIRREIGGSHIVTSIRTLTMTYRVDILIKATPTVIEKFPEIRILIIGDGDQREALEQLAQENGSIDNIRFLGRKNREDIPVYLASSDLYVDPCPSSGGISIGMLEAMSSGLPMIIVKTPGVDEAIEDGVSGLICPQNNPQELAKRMIYLLSDDSKRKDMGLKARKRVEEIGDSEKNFTALGEMYKSLLKK